MKKNQNLTPEDFDRLLYWLNADRDLACQKYQHIQLCLIRTFQARGFWNDADDLADKTFDRVVQILKSGEVPEPYTGDKALYVYKVGQFILQEHIRKTKVMQDALSKMRKDEVLLPHDDSDELEAESACLDQCMEELEEEKRWLAIEYYQFERTEKIENRKKLGIQLGVDLKALRLRVHRIRLQLQPCIETCLEQFERTSNTFV